MTLESVPIWGIELSGGDCLSKFYRITRDVLNRLEYKDRFCVRCGKKFRVGNDVFSKHNKDSKREIWHTRCFNSMFRNL
jgi:hypothetical protein